MQESQMTPKSRGEDERKIAVVREDCADVKNGGGGESQKRRQDAGATRGRD
jgi:hypothetical protein